MGKHPAVLQTCASLLPTFTAHGGHRLLQLRPLSVCMVADTDVNPGGLLLRLQLQRLPAAGAAALCDQGGCVGDGEAGETAGQKHVGVVWQQGDHCVRTQAARLVLQTRCRHKTETLWVKGVQEIPQQLEPRGEDSLSKAVAEKREQRRSRGRVQIDYNRHVLESVRSPLERVLNTAPGESQHFLEFQLLFVRKDNNSQNSRDNRK